MATGDWSFPRSGCSCIRFKTQVAKRPWVGCKMWPALINGAYTGNYPNRYFLSVHQEWSATPLFAARSFSADWDFTVENYGKITSLGGNPISPRGYQFPALLAPADFYAYVIAHGTGLYSFTRHYSSQFSGSGGPVQLAFTPAASTTITILEDFLISWGGIPSIPGSPAPATLRRTWTNELTPAMMDARLREDLESEIAYSNTPTDAANPMLVDNSLVPDIDDNAKAWARGGMVEFPDYNSAVGIYLFEGIVPGSTVDFDLANYGHAHSWQSRLLSQGALPNGKLLLPSSLSRCKIYQPGAHRFETKSLLDGSPAAFCQNLNVACPADSSNGDALYILPPPEKDLEKKQLYLNSQCP